MEESKFIWFDGRMLSSVECKVPFLTHSLHYGSSIFEGIRCYDTLKGPAVFRLTEHITRLFYSANIFGIKIPFSEQQLIVACKEVVKANSLRECYIRPLVFFGEKMGLDTVGAPVHVGIAAWPWESYLGKEGVENGISVKISPFVRPPRNIMPTNAKVSGNYANSIMAKMDALNTGYKEAVLLDINGNVSECSAENIFIVKDNSIITPTTDFTLDGITRKSVIAIAKDIGIKVEERTVKKEELFSSDEAFLTGTAAEITPLSSVDDKPVGSGKPGPITKMIQEKYSIAIHGKDANYFQWLELI
jgi:branched-chain amino acid aminotransferase